MANNCGILSVNKFGVVLFVNKNVCILRLITWVSVKYDKLFHDTSRWQVKIQIMSPYFTMTSVIHCLLHPYVLNGMLYKFFHPVSQLLQ